MALDYNLESDETSMQVLGNEIPCTTALKLVAAKRCNVTVDLLTARISAQSYAAWVTASSTSTVTDPPEKLQKTTQTAPPPAPAPVGRSAR